MNAGMTECRLDFAEMGIAGRLIKLSLVLFALGVLIASPVRDADAASGGKPLRIVAFGDSLTAGYGLEQGQGFVPVLQRALVARGLDVDVVDAGVSGDTTAGGLARLDWVIDDTADAVIVELGANDALRGYPPAQVKANLDAIVTRLTKRGLPVLLAGMRSPENWGRDYADAFNAIYTDLSDKHGTLLYPFFLDGVALEQKLNLADGMHPNAAGIQVIVNRILPSVEQLAALAAARQKQATAQ
ncbi:MAG: arylesterase [Hyphomicrobiaceae bacterium]